MLRLQDYALYKNNQIPSELIQRQFSNYIDLSDSGSQAQREGTFRRNIDPTRANDQKINMTDSLTEIGNSRKSSTSDLGNADNELDNQVIRPIQLAFNTTTKDNKNVGAKLPSKQLSLSFGDIIDGLNNNINGKTFEYKDQRVFEAFEKQSDNDSLLSTSKATNHQVGILCALGMPAYNQSKKTVSKHSEATIFNLFRQTPSSYKGESWSIGSETDILDCMFSSGQDTSSRKHESRPYDLNLLNKVQTQKRIGTEPQPSVFVEMTPANQKEEEEYYDSYECYKIAYRSNKVIDKLSIGHFSKKEFSGEPGLQASKVQTCPPLKILAQNEREDQNRDPHVHQSFNPVLSSINEAHRDIDKKGDSRESANLNGATVFEEERTTNTCVYEPQNNGGSEAKPNSTIEAPDCEAKHDNRSGQT